MSTQQPRRRCLLLSLAVLAGCAAAPPAPPVASASAEGSNEVRILVFRAGSAAALGHNHVLRAGDLRTDWVAEGPVLRFRLDALAVDPPALRERMGTAFAREVGDAARMGTKTNLLKALDAAVHPEVVVRTLQQIGEGARRAVEAEIRLHGQVRRQWFVVDVEGQRARGKVVVRQSDFGVQPFTVLGGLLAVQDALVVEFDLLQP
ncbi:MAG: YceI family protein [Rubrivivax sp.]|nr:MAG: YceI family protein [Rubrivivax sp.]